MKLITWKVGIESIPDEVFNLIIDEVISLRSDKQRSSPFDHLDDTYIVINFNNSSEPEVKIDHGNYLIIDLENETLYSLGYEEALSNMQYIKTI